MSHLLELMVMIWLIFVVKDQSDGDASSQSPVSSLSVSPCHSRGDSHDSVTSPSPPSSKAATLRPKRREEIECDELSKDLAKQLPKNDFLDIKTFFLRVKSLTRFEYQKPCRLWV